MSFSKTTQYCVCSWSRDPDFFTVSCWDVSLMSRVMGLFQMTKDPGVWAVLILHKFSFSA